MPIALTTKASQYVYRKIFGTDIGPEMDKFTKNLGWMIFGVFGSSLLTALFSVLIGRFMGPTEYGKAQVIIGLSNFLLMPILLGINNAMVKYLAPEEDESKKSAIISSSLFYICVSSVFFSAVYFALAGFLAKIFHTQTTIIYWAIFYCVISILYAVLTDLLQGLHQFKKASIIQFATGFLYVGLILFYMLVLEQKTFDAFIMPLISRWVLLGLIILIIIKSYIKISAFSLKELVKLIRYGLYSFLGSISSTIIANTDRLMLNYFHGSRVTGIFGAYATSVNFLSGKFLEAFLAVFFPTASRTQNQPRVYQKIIKIYPFLFLPYLAALIAMTRFGMFIYGREFGFSWTITIIFSLNTAIYSLGAILIYLIASISEKANRFASINTIIAAVLNAAINIFLIPKFQITGALIATTISSIYIVTAAIFFFRKK